MLKSLQVENLFRKLEALPENLKRVAFNKIQEKLPLEDHLRKYCRKLSNVGNICFLCFDHVLSPK